MLGPESFGTFLAFCYGRELELGAHVVSVFPGTGGLSRVEGGGGKVKAALLS